MSATKKNASKSNVQQLSLADTTAHVLKKMGVPAKDFAAGDLKVTSPIDGSLIGTVKMDTPKTLNTKITRAHDAFLAWRVVPGPQRGELIRIFGEVLREHKEELGKLVTLECGKILTEGLGEEIGRAHV